MVIFKEIKPLKAYLNAHRATANSIGFVPTMGALHEGHLSLIKASKAQNTITICSIFVNPAQFNNPTDLEKYPRTLPQDSAMLEKAGCDVLFCPEVSEMYSGPQQLAFDFGHLDKILEGEFRPGHFSGVALVVAKLFNIVRPHRAYFGQKDFQQCKIVSKLAEELKFDIDLIFVPIVREPSGLAMSSRNTRLSEEGKKKASILYQCLQDARYQLLQGKSFSEVKKMVQLFCSQQNVRLEYLALADRVNFTLLENVTEPDQAILLIAGYVEEVRLIDNIYLTDK